MAAIFPRPMVKVNTTRGSPCWVHTAPGAPLTSASRATLARPAKVSERAGLPRSQPRFVRAGTLPGPGSAGAAADGGGTGYRRVKSLPRAGDSSGSGPHYGGQRLMLGTARRLAAEARRDRPPGPRGHERRRK